MAITFRGRPVTPHRLADAVASRVRAYFVHPVIGAAPRFVWGNDAGIRGNVIGRLALLRGRRAWQRSHGGPPPQLEQAMRLRKEGFCPIRPTYPPGVLESVRAAYLEQMASDTYSRWNGVGRYLTASRAIIDPARSLAGVDLLLTPGVQEILRSYYGGDFEVMHIRAWRTLHVPGVDTETDAYSNQWHNDRDPVSMLRFFVYLSDGVTQDTGAFRIHPIPSTREIIRTGGYLHRTMISPAAREMLEDPRRIAYFVGDTGDGCLANVELCLHRAGIPREGYNRDIVQFTLRPSTRRMGEGWVRRLPR